MQDYHNLVVWKRAFEFVLLVYRLTKKFPKEELFGLTSQLRRAAVSVMANIVEGRGKFTVKDFIHYLYSSKGSLNECQCYIELAEGLTYITKDESVVVIKKVNEVGYLLNQLIETLQK